MKAASGNSSGPVTPSGADRAPLVESKITLLILEKQ